ncbi:hypothetical protein BDZ45DRAFT_804827 [Acephala macrosclerotiorum]|nr:hypothetical protein BDZ45DRAFT_804827 [Acephala macrosclerotiorum]
MHLTQEVNQEAIREGDEEAAQEPTEEGTQEVTHEAPQVAVPASSPEYMHDGTPESIRESIDITLGRTLDRAQESTQVLLSAPSATPREEFQIADPHAKTTKQKQGQRYGSSWTIYEGSCSSVKRLDTGLHAVINVLGIIILAAVRAFLTLLSSPTRENLNSLHEKGKWLEIGIPSFRNFAYMHLTRNDDTVSSIVAVAYLIQLGYLYAHLDTLVYLDAYSDLYPTTYSDIIMVTSDTNSTNNLLAWDTNINFDNSQWLCSGPKYCRNYDWDFSVSPCDFPQLEKNPSSWANMGHPIQYCLAARNFNLPVTARAKSDDHYDSYQFPHLVGDAGVPDVLLA